MGYAAATAGITVLGHAADRFLQRRW